MTEAQMIVHVRQYAALQPRYARAFDEPIEALAQLRLLSALEEGQDESEARQKIQDILDNEVRLYPVEGFPSFESQ